jgi:glycosyltransferase involved in cell wall biosynthesis
VLVPPRNPPALAATLVDLLADPERRRALGDEGRRRVAEFTPERVARRFLDAVHSIIERTP